MSKLHSRRNNPADYRIVKADCERQISILKGKLIEASISNPGISGLLTKALNNMTKLEFIRIYDGTTAIVNLLINVELVVDAQDVNLKVRRLEVLRKNGNGWCRVAGQGTQVDEKTFPVNSK